MKYNIKKFGLVCTTSLLLGTLIYTGIPTAYYRGKQRLKKRRNDKKVVYLTFDDGPSKYTSELLDFLDETKVEASFFVVGEFAQKYPELIYRMNKAGHIVGSHSKSHKNAMLFTPRETFSDFNFSYTTLENEGVEPRFYRPPWGQFNVFTAHVAKKYKNKVVLWDVMAEDWRGNTTSDEILFKLRHRVKPGSIICLHDGRGKNEAPKRTIEALKIFIPELKKRDMNF